jgi:flagellar basal body-associated protein FliL
MRNLELQSTNEDWKSERLLTIALVVFVIAVLIATWFLFVCMMSPLPGSEDTLHIPFITYNPLNVSL